MNIKQQRTHISCVLSVCQKSLNQAWNSNIGFPKGSHPFGQVKGWQPLWGVGQSPTYSLKTLRKGWIQKQSGGLFLERGRPAREGVPLIKYDFFDKLRTANGRPYNFLHPLNYFENWFSCFIFFLWLCSQIFLYDFFHILWYTIITVRETPERDAHSKQCLHFFYSFGMTHQ